MIQEEARRFIGKGERSLERKRYEMIGDRPSVWPPAEATAGWRWMQ